MTPLHWTVYRSFKDNHLLIRHLVERGAQLNVQDEEGNTSLHLAVRCGHLEAVKTLLQLGAQREIRNKEGYLAIGMSWNVSASANNRKIVDLIMHHN